MGDPISNLRPLPVSGTDLLGRQAIVRRLVEVLRSDSAAPETVLLDGKWGSGKTSIVNLALATIPEEERSSILLIDACAYQDAEDLTARLIRSLAKHVERPIERNVQQTLAFVKGASGLLKIVSPLVGNATDLLVELAQSLVSPEKRTADWSLEDAMACLAEELNRRGKRLRLVVENLDRLGDAEITRILRSVGALLTLPYVTVLMTGEQGHLVKALDATGYADGHEFIEKYFDYSIYVPLPSQDEIEHLFLNDVLSLPGSPDRQLARYVIQKIFPSRISTLRTAFKLANSMKLSAMGMIHDGKPLFNWIDLLHFEALRQIYPKDFQEFVRSLGRTEDPVSIFTNSFGKEEDRSRSEDRHGYSTGAMQLISELCEYDFTTNQEKASRTTSPDFTSFRYEPNRIVYIEGGVERSGLTHSRVSDLVSQIEDGNYQPLIPLRDDERRFCLHESYGLVDKARLRLLRTLASAVSLAPFRFDEREADSLVCRLFHDVLYSSPKPTDLLLAVIPILKRVHLARRTRILTSYNLAQTFRNVPSGTTFVEEVFRDAAAALRSAPPSSPGYFAIFRAMRHDLDRMDVFLVDPDDLRWTKQFFQYITCNYLAQFDWETEFRSGRDPQFWPSLESVTVLNELKGLRAENRKLLRRLTKLVRSQGHASA